MGRSRKKDISPERTVDEIRELILSFLYSKYKNTRSVKGVRVASGRIEKELKKAGLKENEIASNLFFLTRNGWVDEVKERYEFIPPHTGIAIPVERIFYRISDYGINHFEGPSKFQRPQRFDGINITNIQGAIAIGDGNIVQNQFSNLYRNLDLLGEEIRRSNEFADVEKLNYQAEIETIKSQLAKPVPDKGILQKAWEKLKPLATVGGIVSFFEAVKAFIEPLIS